MAWVQADSVGKYGMRFSGYCSLSRSQRCMNSGQVLAQLVWVELLQFTHQVVRYAVHWVVWCSPLQVPQVSSRAAQLRAIWPYRWHLAQRMGSFRSLRTAKRLLSMQIPSRRMSLAVAAVETWSKAKALHCVWVRRRGGLIHRMDARESVGS